MRYSGRLEVRLAASDEARLDAIIERTGRTASELMRLIIRNLDIGQVSTGIPPLTLHVEVASEPRPTTTPANPRREAVLA